MVRVVFYLQCIMIAGPTTESQLTDWLETTCDRFNQYSVHRQFTDIQRFAAGQSETFKTLESMRKRGLL
jgi:hypothetical protein